MNNTTTQKTRWGGGGRIMSFMAALAMTVALVLTGPGSALALNTSGAVDDTGAKATTGAIHVHKYKTTAPSGTAGTGGADQKLPADAETLDGANFTLYKLDTSKVEGGVAGTNAAASAPSAAEVTNFLTTYQDTAFAAKTLATAGGGLADFTGLEFSYYLLVEDAAAAAALDVAPAAPSIVTVPYADGTGTGTLRADVHVYPKNVSSDPITKQQVADPTDPTIKNPGELVVPGDSLKYEISATVPAPVATTGGALSSTTQVYLEDKLPVNTAGDMTLAINPAKTVVTAVQQSGASFVIPAADYVYVAATKAGVAPVAANTARWTLDVKGIASINAVAATNPVVKVKVSIVAQVTDAAFITGTDDAGQPIVRNEATGSVTDGTGNVVVKPGTDTDSETVLTAGFKFTKTDTANKALEGATFALAPTYADATAGNYLVKPTSGAGTTTPGWAGATVWTETSSATGLVTFAGLGSNLGVLPAGGGTATAWTTLNTEITALANNASTTLDVWVVETAAPNDYRILQAPQKVTLTITKDATGNVTANAGNALSIVNTKNGETGGGNFALPNTGGMGTIAFVVVGIVLIGSAALYFGRRKKNER